MQPYNHVSVWILETELWVSDDACYCVTFRDVSRSFGKHGTGLCDKSTYLPSISTEALPSCEPSCHMVRQRTLLSKSRNITILYGKTYLRSTNRDPCSADYGRNIINSILRAEVLLYWNFPINPCVGFPDFPEFPSYGMGLSVYFDYCCNRGTPINCVLVAPYDVREVGQHWLR